MLLSDYDRVVVLYYDRRYGRQKDRVEDMLFSRGVPRSAYSGYIDGEGYFLASHLYDQVVTQDTVPTGWVHGKGAWAHFGALKTIVHLALADGVENLLFVEDDCVFRDDFDGVVSAATEQMKGLPDWDMLYYGANHAWAATEELSPNVLKLHGSYTTHCLGIRGRMFDAIVDLPPVHVIDNVIAHRLHPAYNCYAVWPNVARQLPGYSHLSYVTVDYNKYFDSKGVNW